MNNETWITDCCNAKYRPSNKTYEDRWNYIECTKCGKITNIHNYHATASKLRLHPYGDVKIK